MRPAAQPSTSPRGVRPVILLRTCSTVLPREMEAMLEGRPRRRPRAPGVCVGIDLAGVPHRETGVAVLRAGRLELLTTAGEDEEILALARLAGRWGTVAINAPLTRPLGRCCLDDDCPCRTDPGTRSRQLERDLGH